MLLVRAARTAKAAGLGPVLAVVRDMQWQAALEPLKVDLVLNQHAAEGMASSVRAGAAALAGTEVKGAVFLTCDQPLLQPEHLVALCALPERLTGSSYGGRTGVPAYIPAALFPALLLLEGDVGARSLLRDAATIVNEDLALDIDTEADVQRAAERFGETAPGTQVQLDR